MGRPELVRPCSCLSVQGRKTTSRSSHEGETGFSRPDRGRAHRGRVLGGGEYSDLASGRGDARGPIGPIGAGSALANAGRTSARETCCGADAAGLHRSEEHTSELQSPYVISYAVFCLKKK